MQDIKQRMAVIDLGTNTFHILIADAQADGQFSEVFRYRRYVKLAEAGIATIGEAPFQRGIEALSHFATLLEQYEVKAIKAIGTAALRTASNGQAFIQKAKEKTGIEIELISGDEEAQLIYEGVRQAIPLQDEKVLIMDIGGGSVEFIIADASQIYWAQSFKIGVAVLFDRFHKQDPIANSEIEALKAFLKTQLEPLTLALKQHSCTTLIGASGTFDVLEAILVKEKESSIYSKFDAKLFFPFYQKLLPSTVSERKAMKNIPNTRVDMIIVALILINYTLKVSAASLIKVSAYALKEGILNRMKGSF